MSFPQRLKDLRTEKKLTQRELSSIINLSPNSICEWEKGRCEPSIDALKKLSRIFECSIDYIVGNADDFGNITVLESTPALSPDEKKLLDDYRALNTKNKIHVSAYASIRLEEQEDNVLKRG